MRILAIWSNIFPYHLHCSTYCISCQCAEGAAPPVGAPAAGWVAPAGAHACCRRQLLPVHHQLYCKGQEQGPCTSAYRLSSPSSQLEQSRCAALSCECAAHAVRLHCAAALSECSGAAAAAVCLELLRLSVSRCSCRRNSAGALRRNDRAACPPCARSCTK